MRILAVAVTYNPEIALLAQVLGSASSQVQGLVVVDNGSANVEDIRRTATQAGGQTIENLENIGIAAAQNQGVARALANGFTHVLLLDQDTVFKPGTVMNMAHDLSSLDRDEGRTAAIGPAYFELNSQRQTRAYRADGVRLSRLSLANETRPVASDFIIASGSLIPLSVLKAVGGFKENLFIDLVDVEWCFRARAAGYRSYLSPMANVEHQLGSGTVQVGTREVAVHVPIRNYYWVRNALWLARQPYTPLAWKLYFVSRSLAFLATYPALADQRAARLKLILKGIRDSVAGRLGPING
ncbi:glycosyltransferase family 2 protein [Microvirga terrae]|uniref:Glycosyltransferase family 2 protein n=1 Tax=Microvirga terrae TaxID=2740529 RepID=A0ABY5RN40_9HYPH|nr:glycosyltransferase family 2 protein [Microvirga terrae]UVF18368.1 glycosyltransferase family 2 protein [Microvirga terrae]